MRLTYLGTAAAEGLPAVFCNCNYCQNARKLGGKNIRTRSQALVNDDLLIDFPADAYYHFLTNNVEAHRIKYLFFTHSHEDHLYPDELRHRGGAYAHNMQVPVLQVFGNEDVCSMISANNRIIGCELIKIRPYEKVHLDGYEVIPLPARHQKGKNALIYIIKGDKTLLYAHDTGYFYDEVFEYIEKEGLYFDLISMDCTNVEIPIIDEGPHMGIPNIDRLIIKLEKISAIDDKTVKYINHFSHNANPLQERLEALVEDKGYCVAYDGCQVCI